LLENGAGVAGIAQHIGVLAFMGIVFLGIGAAALRRTARRGASA